jgi:hypothetical protein
MIRISDPGEVGLRIGFTYPMRLAPSMVAQTCRYGMDMEGF